MKNLLPEVIYFSITVALVLLFNILDHKAGASLTIVGLVATIIWVSYRVTGGYDK